MKTLILLIAISFSAMASNWMPASKIQEKSVQAYQLESDCLKTGEQCFDVGQEPQIVSIGFVSLINDWGPESEIESCDGEPDCIAKLDKKSCPGDLQKFMDAGFTKTYCIQLLGKILVKNESLISAYKSEQISKAQFLAGISAAQKMRDCGSSIINLFLVLNAPKKLTKQQVKQLALTFAPIQDLLLNGSIATAKEEILAATANGVTVTESDKAALAAAADKCLGL